MLPLVDRALLSATVELGEQVTAPCHVLLTCRGQLHLVAYTVKNTVKSCGWTWAGPGLNMLVGDTMGLCWSCRPAGCRNQLYFPSVRRCVCMSVSSTV
jgi:hypothetical protein